MPWDLLGPLSETGGLTEINSSYLRALGRCPVWGKARSPAGWCPGGAAQRGRSLARGNREEARAGLAHFQIALHTPARAMLRPMMMFFPRLATGLNEPVATDLRTARPLAASRATLNSSDVRHLDTRCPAR
jgi:hypothetical protein